MSGADLLTAFYVISGIASILGLLAVFLRRETKPGIARAAGPRRSVRVQFAATVLAAIAVSCGFTAARGGIGCQHLLIASSKEKFELLQDLAVDYNAAGRYLGSGGGRCSSVSIEQVNSGDAESYLEGGWQPGPDRPARPDVWAPASSAWLQLLASARPGGPSLQPYGFLFQSPLVIGMPQPMAEALGYPALPIGWQDVFALATNPKGWGARGHPEWGAFRLGKTNPHVSTSGLHALVGTFDASAAAVGSPAAQAFAAGIEASVLHYGVTADDFLKNLYEVDNAATPPTYLASLQYVSAIAVEEKELTDYNLGRFGRVQRATPHVALVPIYPSPATLVADHPYLVLDPAKRELASDFFGYVHSAGELAKVDAAGFRIGKAGEAGPQLASRQFVDKTSPSVRNPGVPAGADLRTELRIWDAVRKPARVLILADRSLDTRTASYLAGALDGFQAQDQVGLAVYPAGSGAAYRLVLPVGPADDAGKAALRAAITAEAAGPSGSPEGALSSALKTVQAEFDPRAINAIVLVERTPAPGNAPAQLTTALRNQAPDHFVRVFTVGPDDPDKRPRLGQIALAGQGSTYDPRSSRAFLNDVISNF